MLIMNYKFILIFNDMSMILHKILSILFSLLFKFFVNHCLITLISVLLLFKKVLMKLTIFLILIIN